MSINISVQQAIQWLNGQNTDEKTILAIKEMGVLRYLENLTMSWQRSRAPYSGSLQNGGTLIWKLPHLIPVHNYAENQSAHVQKWDVITSNEITRRSGIFNNEYFDYRMATPEQAVASVGMIVGSLATSAAADTNAAFWTKVNDYKDAHPEQTMFLPNLVAKKVLTADEAKEITVQLAHKRNDLTQIYNSKMYGVNPNEYRTTINGAGAINLSQILLTLNNSVNAFDLAKKMISDPFTNGVANPNAVIGGRIIIDNFLNLKVDQNVAWSEDTDFNTEGLLGTIFHEDFIAFPTLEPAFGVREIPNNLNHNYIVEYAYAYAYLRPKLFCAIVDSFEAFAVGQDLHTIATDVEGYEVKVGSKLTINSNKYFADASTSLSVASGVTGVTVSGKEVTGVTASATPYTVTVTNGTDTVDIKVKVIAA